jgi:hypothetical protein
VSKKKAGNGPNFRSKFEEDIWNDVGGEETLEYEQERIPYVIKGTYIPDYRIKGTDIFLEAKGRLDAATCRKMIAVKASNPKLDIRFIFYDANKKLNKRSKMRHWEWAEKHGYPWCQGRVPLEWLKEKND